MTDDEQPDEPSEFWLFFREWGRQQQAQQHEAAPRPTPERPDVHLARDDETPRLISDPLAYGRRALTSAIDNVRISQEGYRNDTLNAAAYSMGRLIGANLLDEATVVDALTTAADECGLQSEETRKTIASGIKAGVEAPIAWQLSPSEHIAVMRPVGADPHGEIEAMPDGVLYGNEYRLQKVRRQVKRDLDAEERAGTRRTPPAGHRGDEFLAMEDEAVEWLIKDVLPFGANATLAAPYKTGKTTLMGELLRSLCDGASFLDTHLMHGDFGNVGIFDYEMQKAMHRRWIRDVGIVNTAVFHVRHIRGYSLDLLDDDDMADVIEWLASRAVGVWILDPFARAYQRDENDNAAVTEWTNRLDLIKQESGVHTLVMPVHTGRREGSDVRARGATRLDDWPDVRWLMRRNPTTDVRYFSAYGRDVDLDETPLAFDIDRRRLSVDLFAVDERTATVSEAAEIVFAVLPEDGEAVSHAEICRRLDRAYDPANKAFVNAGMEALVNQGRATNYNPGNGYKARRTTTE